MRTPAPPPQVAWEPACMPRKEWLDWQRANAQCAYPVASVCSDCPVSWQRARKSEGRCNRQPAHHHGRPVTLHDPASVRRRAAYRARVMTK